MKPATESARVTRIASEPSKAGKGREKEGGATAPAQNAEQALQEECFSLPALACVSSLSEAASAACPPWWASASPWESPCIACIACPATGTADAGDGTGAHDMLMDAAAAWSGRAAIKSQTSNVVSRRFIDWMSITRRF